MGFEFTIGITTRNRWDDLKITLQKIRGFGWKEPIIIIDDNSDIACPFDVSQLIGNCTLERYTESKGLIVRRNQIARMVETPYYLSLDDDSYPQEGSIDNALKHAKSAPEIFCIAFPIYNPIEHQYQVASHKAVPYQVRSFIGCAHLMDVKKFQDLGGYREELVHQGEEVDLSVRAFQRGWKVFHLPSLMIVHQMSMNSRNWERMDYFGARNNILWNDWYLPGDIKILVQFKNIFSRIWLAIKVRRGAQLSGMWDAARRLKDWKKFRNPLTSKEYSAWRNLPSS